MNIIRKGVALCGSLVVIPLLLGATWFAFCVVVCGVISNGLYQVALYIYLRSDWENDVGHEQMRDHRDDHHDDLSSVVNTNNNNKNSSKHRYKYSKQKFNLNVLRSQNSPVLTPLVSTAHTYNIAQSLETMM